MALWSVLMCRSYKGPGQCKKLLNLPRSLKLEAAKKVVTPRVRTGSRQGLFYFLKKV